MKGIKFFLILLFVGCAGVAVKPLDPFSPPPIERPCTIYEDNGITSGLIYDNVLNPCAAHNILILMKTYYQI